MKRFLMLFAVAMIANGAFGFQLSIENIEVDNKSVKVDVSYSGCVSQKLI